MFEFLLARHCIIYITSIWDFNSNVRENSLFHCSSRVAKFFHARRRLLIDFYKFDKFSLNGQVQKFICQFLDIRTSQCTPCLVSILPLKTSCVNLL